MPRKKPRVPSYCLHKRSGQAIVVLSGKMFYLGPYGSEVSKREYDRVVGEWCSPPRFGTGSKCNGKNFSAVVDPLRQSNARWKTPLDQRTDSLNFFEGLGTMKRHRRFARKRVLVLEVRGSADCERVAVG